MDQENQGQDRDKREENRDGRRDRDGSRSWLWPGVALGSLLLLALLLLPMNLNNRQQIPPGGRNMLEQTPLPGTPGGENVGFMPDRTDRTDRMEDNSPEQLNRRIASAARSVEGVQNAWGITSGSIALVAVELNDMVRGQVEAVKDEVSDQVEELPGIDRAIVTADPDLVVRIRKISEGIAAGQPLSSFRTEIDALLRSLAPAG